MNDIASDWPHKTHIAVNPAKRRGLVIIGVLFAACTVLAAYTDDIAAHFVKADEHESLLPQMQTLANQGKPAAVAWMTKNVVGFGSQTQYSELRKAAETGDPECMYLYGVALILQNDLPGSQVYLERSAAAGYSKAILQLEYAKTHD